MSIRRGTLLLLVALVVACRPAPASKDASAGPPRPNPAKGRALFEYTCEACHYADRNVVRAGPPLMGLYSRVFLINNTPVSDKYVERLIRSGTGRMPGYYDKISPEQMRDLIAFLRTL